MLRMAVEAGVAGIGHQARAKCQLCVPAVEMNVESYRRRAAAARVARKPKSLSDSKRDSDEQQTTPHSSGCVGRRGG